MQFNLELKNKTILDGNLRWVEIYRITNKINQKVYIGQAISHRKNMNKYTPKGMEGRFKEHIKEVKIHKKYHCNALNNAIKTYGVENFKIELLHRCSVSEANQLETDEIKNHSSLVPNGYNINTSCNSLLPSDEIRTKISNGNIIYHFNKHLKKFENYDFNAHDSEFDKYISPRMKNNTQLGWYLRLNKKVIEFKSTISDLNETKERLLKFLQLLKKETINKQQRIQTAGTSLEPSLPLTYGNIREELV